MKRALGFVLIIILLFICGCGTGRNILSEDTVFAFDTFMSFSVYSDDEKVTDRLVERVYELENMLSVTDTESEVYEINESRGNEVTISGELEKIIKTAVEVSTETEGAFDITAYPYVRAWGFTTGEYRIPSEGELNDISGTVGYEKIKTDQNKVVLSDGAMIDLGGIAKGFLSDNLIDFVKEEGCPGALLNLGGNICVVGKKPGNIPWNIGIASPYNQEKLLGTIEATDECIITSGGYERYFEGSDGEIYWHIINPKTGYPAKSGLVSVTVVGKNGMVCDALSTALFVMGEERALDYYKEHDGFEMILVTEDGRVLVSEGLEERFTIDKNSFSGYAAVGKE